MNGQLWVLGAFHCFTALNGCDSLPQLVSSSPVFVAIHPRCGEAQANLLPASRQVGGEKTGLYRSRLKG